MNGRTAKKLRREMRKGMKESAVMSQLLSFAIKPPFVPRFLWVRYARWQGRRLNRMDVKDGERKGRSKGIVN